VTYTPLKIADSDKIYEFMCPRLFFLTTTLMNDFIQHVLYLIKLYVVDLSLNKECCDSAMFV